MAEQRLPKRLKIDVWQYLNLIDFANWLSFGEFLLFREVSRSTRMFTRSYSCFDLTLGRTSKVRWYHVFGTQKRSSWPCLAVEYGNDLKNCRIEAIWPFVHNMTLNHVTMRTQYRGKLPICLLEQPLRKIKVLECRNWFHPALIEKWLQVCEISRLDLHSCVSVTGKPLHISRSLAVLTCRYSSVPVVFGDVRFEQLLLQMSLREFILHTPRFATWFLHTSSILMTLSHNGRQIDGQDPEQAFSKRLETLTPFRHVRELRINHTLCVTWTLVGQLGQLFPSLRRFRMQTNRQRELDVTEREVCELWPALQHFEMVHAGEVVSFVPPKFS